MQRYITSITIAELDGYDIITKISYINAKNVKYVVGGGSKKQRLAIDISTELAKSIKELAQGFWKGWHGTDIHTIFVSGIAIKYDDKSHEPIAFAPKIRCVSEGSTFGEHPLSTLPSPEPIHVSSFAEQIIKLSELVLFELDSWQKDLNAQMELDLGLVDEVAAKARARSAA
jgi:hypothetical protein